MFRCMAHNPLVKVCDKETNQNNKGKHMITTPILGSMILIGGGGLGLVLLIVVIVLILR